MSYYPQVGDIGLDVLKIIKAPDDYAYNLSSSFIIKGRKISKLKSNDSHVLMQQLLHIPRRAALP